MTKRKKTSTAGTKGGPQQRPSAPAAAAFRDLNLAVSSAMPGWLATQGCSIAVTTYQAGAVFALGVQANGSLYATHARLKKPTGMWAERDLFHVADTTCLWTYRNILSPGEQGPGGCDSLYQPHRAAITGNLDIHDIAPDKDGRLHFINCLFSSLCQLDDRYAFRPVWMPPYCSHLESVDACHLNGLAMRDGVPRYVTLCSATSTPRGWRTDRVGKGHIVDLKTGDLLAPGMTMPHSPRYYRGKLWVLDSGAGRFVSISPESGQIEEVCILPGFARGLVFRGDYAVIGLSKPRHNDVFKDLPLGEVLVHRRMTPRVGVVIVDLRTGVVAHQCFFEGPVVELYDVALLEGTLRPRILSFYAEENELFSSFPPLDPRTGLPLAGPKLSGVH